MRIGTRSVLFGAHQFLIHPWFVALGWWKLYGFPFDPRLWVAFFVHDIGYLGKPNMDGDEGELHPFVGASIMGFLFGDEWWYFALGHSRFLAKRLGMQPSRLCIADKLAICLTPAWIYIPLVNLSGEIKEYMNTAKFSGMSDFTFVDYSLKHQMCWYRKMQSYVRKWVDEHKDGREDTWTPPGKRY